MRYGMDSACLGAGEGDQGLIRMGFCVFQIGCGRARLRDRAERISVWGCRKNPNPSDKFENESGKSSEFLSLTYSILTLLRYSRPAKIPADEYSDSPSL